MVDNGRIMKELKELHDSSKTVSKDSETILTKF